MCLLEGEKEITSDNDILSEVILWTNKINIYILTITCSLFLLLTLKFNYLPSKGDFNILWVFIPNYIKKDILT